MSTTIFPPRGAADTAVPSQAADTATNVIPLARGGRLTFAQLCDGYMAQYAGRDAGIVSRMQFWRERFAEREAFAVSPDDVADALADLAALGRRRIFMGGAGDAKKFKHAAKPLAPATINRFLTTLGGLYKFARKRRLAPRGWTSPTRGIERQEENNERVRFLSEEERERLLAVCRIASWRQLYLLVLMALTTGARKSELLALPWGGIDLEGARAYVPTSKNGEPRVLVLVPAVLEELTRFWKRSHASEAFVFPSDRRPGQAMDPTRPWNNALRAARIERFRFHDLRHTCASYLAQSGASPLEIADVLGHKQMRMVLRYAHLSTGSKAALVGRVLGKIR